MTLDEARRELGIDAEATPEEVRRAYLRGVKVRKPETDPEGFRRLREAYELLTATLARQEETFTAPPSEEEEVEEDGEEVSPEIAALASRLADLPAETRLEERLAALREAVREHPKSLGVRWWLIEELGRAGRREEALEVLRQGDADGLPGFLESRAANFPGSLGPEDLARLEANRSPGILALTARVYMAASRHEEAAAALGRALDQIVEWDNPALHPVPVWLPRGILALEAAGKATEARALHDRLWAWLSGTGDAALIQRWGYDFFWRLLHELGKLDPRFPPELRQAAAKAALEGDWRKAVPEAEALARADRRRAEEASAFLYDLPILYSCFFKPLQRIDPRTGQPAAPGGGGFSLRFLGWLVFMAAMTLLRTFGRSDYPGSSPASNPPVPNVQAMNAEVIGAWSEFRPSCEETPTPLPPDLCGPAREIVRNLGITSCWAARNDLSTLESALNKAADTSSLGPALLFESRLKHALKTGCFP